MRSMLFFIDGGARPNPGRAAYGLVMLDDATTRVWPPPCWGDVLPGASSSNNEAEWHGMVHAMETAAVLTAGPVHIVTDSQLVARQMSGAYAVRMPSLQPLHARATAARAVITGQGRTVTITHVPRAQNRLADALATHAILAGRRVTWHDLPEHVVARIKPEALRAPH